MQHGRPDNRLIAVSIDAQSLGPGTTDQAQERDAAIADLVEDNSFTVVGHDRGPYAVMLGLRDSQLVFDIRTATGAAVVLHVVSLRPLRAVLRDYLMIRDAHGEALRSAHPSRIQTIDMGRRGLHDEGAAQLADRLAGKVVADFQTLRRLFTLLAALHRRN